MSQINWRRLYTRFPCFDCNMESFVAVNAPVIKEYGRNKKKPKVIKLVTRSWIGYRFFCLTHAFDRGFYENRY